MGLYIWSELRGILSFNGTHPRPELFKCAIGVVGIYDLPMLYEKRDVSDRDSGVAFVKKVVSTDEAELKKYSPVHRADELNLPIFITHGEQNPGAPVEHKLLMMETMDAAEKPYKKLLFEKEGHGLYDPATRAGVYKAIVAFLKNLLKVMRPMRYKLPQCLRFVIACRASLQKFPGSSCSTGCSLTSSAMGNIHCLKSDGLQFGFTRRAIIVGRS